MRNALAPQPTAFFKADHLHDGHYLMSLHARSFAIKMEDHG